MKLFGSVHFTDPELDRLYGHEFSILADVLSDLIDLDLTLTFFAYLSTLYTCTYAWMPVVANLNHPGGNCKSLY